MFFQKPIFASFFGFFESPLVLKEFDQRAFEGFLDHLGEVISRVEEASNKFTVLSSSLEEAYNSYQSRPRAFKILTHLRAISLGTWVPSCLWASSFQEFQDELLVDFLKHGPSKDLDVLKIRCHLVSVLLGGKDFASSKVQEGWRKKLDHYLDQEDLEQFGARNNLSKESVLSALEWCLIFAFGGKNFDFLMMKILFSLLSEESPILASWLQSAFEKEGDLQEFLDVVESKAIAYQAEHSQGGVFFYDVLCHEIRVFLDKRKI